MVPQVGASTGARQLEGRRKRKNFYDFKLSLKSVTYQGPTGLYVVLTCRPFTPKISGSISQEELTTCSLHVENTEKEKREELCVSEAVYSKCLH